MPRYVVLVFLFWAGTALAEDKSWFFINPPTIEYSKGSFGAGKLKICKALDEIGVNYQKNMPIPMGTYFADVGPIEGYDLSKPQRWLLTVATTSSVMLHPAQKCVVVNAHVVETGVPPTHTDLNVVHRFNVSDKRLFEISAPNDINAPIPDLAPWNSDYPSINAKAISDFK